MHIADSSRRCSKTLSTIAVSFPLLRYPRWTDCNSSGFNYLLEWRSDFGPSHVVPQRIINHYNSQMIRNLFRGPKEGWMLGFGVEVRAQARSLGRRLAPG